MAQPAEITLILNTDQFLQAAKELAPELEKALKLDAKTLGNQVIEDRQKALKGNLVEARLLSKETNSIAKGLTTKGLEEYSDKLEPILGTTRKLIETTDRLKTVQARIGELEGNGEGSLASLKGRIGGVKGKSEKEAARRAYQSAKQELVDLKKEETNLLITQAQLNQTFDEQYPKVKYICDTMKKVNAEGSKNKEHIEAINATYDALKDTTSQTKHNIEDANRALDEMEVPKSGIDSVKEETAALQDAVSAEKELSAIKKVENETEAKDGHAEERENKILDQVKAIYELRLAGEDAGEEFAKLQELLNFDASKADVGELARFLHDAKEATQYISTDLSNTEKLDDVFKDITKATVPASQAFTQLTNSFKSNTMAAEAQEKALKEVLSAGEYVARLNLDPTTQDFASIAQSLGILQSAESLARKLGVPDEVKGQYDEIVRAIIRLKDAQSTLKKETLSTSRTYEEAMNEQAKSTATFSYAVAAVTQQMQTEFHQSMQSVIDTTDRISNAMRFDGPNVSIAELIRRLHDLKEAQQTLEGYGLPKEMDARYELIQQLIAQTTQQINAYKQSLKDSVAPAQRAGKAVGDAGKQASKSADEFKLAAGSLKQLKDGFGTLSKLGNSVKSSFNSMARDMKSNFKHLLTSITKYVFGFRSLFFLIRRLRKYLVEGIENLVQFDSANNQTNAAISELRTSLLFLKNAWAAAFAPIINIVVPIINSFLDALAIVGNAVARFIGFLTGQAPVINAVRVSAGDYAESLSGVGDSAGGAAEKVKELTDRLADFDDLDVLGVDKDPSDTGSGGGGGGGGGNTPSIDDMFEWVDVDDSLFDKLKESWEKADFTWLGELLRDKIIEALDWLNDHWDEIQAVADKIGHSLGSFLVGLLGEPELWEKSAHAIAEAFNTINIGISAFLDELDKIPFGENAGKGVNEFLSVTDWELAGDNINRVITGIIDNITKFIEELDAEKIASAISEFLEGIDIPEIIASVGELTIKATKLLVEVIGELILNTSTKFADALTKWVQKSITTTYVDSNGVHVKLSFELETDWTEHSIIALFEKIALGIGATISKGVWTILIKFGIYNGDFGKFIADADKFLTPFRELIDGFFESVAHGMLVLPNIISDFFTSVIHGGQVVTDWISDFWQKLVEFEEHPFDLFGDTSNSDLSTNAGEAFKNLLGKWGIDVDAKLDEIKNTIVTKFGEIKDKIIEKTDEIKENLSIAWGNLKTDAEEKWNLVKDTITGAVETVKTDVEEKWGSIETAVTTAWDNVSTKTQEVWDGMKTKITEEVIPAITEFINTNIPPLVTTIQTNWETIRTNTEEKWELVKGYVIDKFGEAKANLEENLPLFQEFVSTKWEEMSENARIKWDEIKSSIKDKFREAKDDVVNKARELYNKVSGYWDDLKRSTYDKFSQIKTSIINIFEALSRAIKTPLNNFIGAIEGMVNFVIDGINKLMDAVQAFLDLGGEWLAQFGLPEVTVTHLEHVSLPRLAQGAVIPPNNEFLAVLGDQSHGTNIEAPLDTIKQAVAEVLANNGNEEVIELLQQLIRVVESKNLTIGDKDIGKANARYTNKQNIIRGTSF